MRSEACEIVIIVVGCGRGGSSCCGCLERGGQRGLRGQLSEDGGELGRSYEAGVGEVFEFLRERK